MASVRVRLAFGAVELRRRHPLLDVRLFGVPAFATGAATITVFFFAMFGFMFVVMQHIQLILGYSPIKTAFALTPLMGPMLVLSALSFWYLPRVGLRAVVFVGLRSSAAGLVCLPRRQVDSTYWDLAWPMLMMSTGIGLCTAPTTSAIMNTVPDDKQGVASAVNDTTREIGAALGIALAGSMLAAATATRSGHDLSATPPRCAKPRRTRSASARGCPPTRPAAPTSPNSARRPSSTRWPRRCSCSRPGRWRAVLIAVWAPGRDGEQLRIVRRLRSRDRPVGTGPDPRLR